MVRAGAWLRVFFRVRNDPLTKGTVMTSWSFWRQSLERSVKTGAQFILVFVGGDAFNVFEIDVVTAGGFALAGMAVSILTSVASAPFAQTGTPSAVDQ